MVISDEQLMQETCKDSVPAFDLLLQRWHRRMYAYFLRCTNDTYLSEDLCQELFFKVYRQRAQYTADRPFKPWIYRIATNLTIDQVVRKRRVESCAIDSEENVILISHDPDSRALAVEQEASEQVERALDQLPSDMRMLLIMRHYEDLKFSEIAEVLNLPESTVKLRVYRALDTVRRYLKQSGFVEANCLKI